MSLNIRDKVGQRLSAAMTWAQSGEADRATDDLKVLLRELGSAPSHERAAAEYVLCVAGLRCGYPGQAIRAIDACLDMAESLGDAGWLANARALRAYVLITSDRTLEAIDDVVRAEYDLGLCDDDALASWAHTGLGNAYEAFRMFEEAVPHYEQAIESDVDVFELPESRYIDASNLASVNLLWARELIMLGSVDREPDVKGRLAEARRWSEVAVNLANGEKTDPNFLPMARFLRASSAWRSDPREWIDELAQCRDDLGGIGYEDYALEATASLAFAYSMLQDLDVAEHEAARAMDALDSAADPNLQRYVRWSALKVSAALGHRAATDGLELARTIANGWWAQHESDLQIMRSAVAAYARARSVELDVQAAREDPLTGLGNRRAFSERIEEATHRRAEISMISIDIDGLKRLNDTFGHDAGDRALSAVAEVIMKNIRADDLAIRFGGDEFVIILEEPGPEDADLVVDRLRVAIRLAGLTEKHSYLRGVGLSVGIASTAEGLSIEELLEMSDRRMYDEKRRHIDRVG